MVSRDYLETTLAGTVFLVEYDGRYQRILTWLWQYGLSRDTFNTFRIELEVPDIFRSGSSFWIIGGTTPVKIGQKVLERKWSGRLYILGYRKQPLMLLRYLWEDIRSRFADLLGHGCR